MNQFLTRTEVALRGFYGAMSEQKLDLLQFAPCGVAEPGAGPSKVMRSEPVDASYRRVFADGPLDDLFADS